MFTLPPRSISEAILQLFRERQDYTVAEILALVRTRYYNNCSQRAVYKQIKELIERGVIIRSGPRYSLSLTWVLALIRTAEDLYGTLVDRSLKSSYLPKAGEKRSWHFDDLQHLDRFWIQMIFLLFEESNSREMYVWVPYFWFDLIHYHKDLEAQEAMRVAGNKMFMILGDDSFIARRPIEYWSKEVYEWSYAEGPFKNQMTTYYDVIDDLVMTIELTPKTTRQIRDLFHAVRGPEDLDQLSRFESIKSNAPTKLTIERNQQKARRLQKKFRDYFDVG